MQLNTLRAPTKSVGTSKRRADWHVYLNLGSALAATRALGPHSAQLVCLLLQQWLWSPTQESWYALLNVLCNSTSRLYEWHFPPLSITIGSGHKTGLAQSKFESGQSEKVKVRLYMESKFLALLQPWMATTFSRKRDYFFCELISLENTTPHWY
jgi:hypothetical protein